ncbi:phage tail protein [Teredinibacter franksiae]|uniref:phage tail protein n=1 Tax=Teredinibacter franksiae TaxID=2761453 RepID=UPI001623F4FF|nr:tail fiber protein [Teredinibacter franksiae]
MDNPFIGQICAFGFNFAPRNWAFCSGAMVAISSNTALFSLLGTAYGGDGRSTFGLPDLRGKAGMSAGQHPGSLYDWRVGQQAGSELHTLSASELANHSHVAVFTPGSGDTDAEVNVSTDAATQDAPTEGAYLAKNDGGRSDGVLLYRADAGAGTVKLGGVAGGSGAGGNVDIQSTGGSSAFSLMQPALVMNYCIATQGLYPSRS